MDKRSWPWKKKPSDKVTAYSESFDPTRNPDGQDAVSNGTLIPDGPKITSQEYEQKIKELTEKLSAASMDATSKDLLVKQHAKVAEEAVSGWEKAESETATLRGQLDSAIQQRLAAEDRVSHLDGALKECMRQLRHAREEQEENIHDAIVKKTRDWDLTRSELEERLADLEQRFLERDAENKAITKSLQERAKTIAELSDARSAAEAEVSLLRVRLESCEKEKNAFKYELHVSQKELEIRNEEKGMSKRAVDVANKQHLEDIKRISKLEAECQRLRGLIRKKLPGPGAVAQMKLEIESLNMKDNRKKTTKSAQESMQDVHEDNHHQDREGSSWSERYSALEEETKMLRESLSKKSNELQSARLMCARTASKLSLVEHQLEALASNQGINQKIPPTRMSVSDMNTETARSLSDSMEQSIASASDDGNDGEVSCAESWASALIVELDQFRKEKKIHVSTKAFGSSKTDLDDFMEMEQLASLSPISVDPIQEIRRSLEHKDVKKSIGISSSAVEHGLKSEIQDTCRRYEEVSGKLANAEEEVLMWKSKDAENQVSLSSLKEKLDMLFEAQEANADIYEVLDEIREDMGMPSHSMGSLRNQIRRLAKGPGHNEEASSYKITETTLEVGSTICKVVELVEELSVDCQLSLSINREVKLNHGKSPSRLERSMLTMESFSLGEEQLKIGELDMKRKRLINIRNAFLQSKANLLELMVELASILSYILKMRRESKGLGWDGSSHESGEMEYSGTVSPTSDTSKSDCSEEAAKIVPTDENNLDHDDKNVIFSSKILKLEEELRKALNEKNIIEEELRRVISEKAALETHMKAELTRFNAIEQELVTAKKMERAKIDEMSDALNAQLHETEQHVKVLEARICSLELLKKHGEEEFRRVCLLKEQTDSELESSRVEVIKLQERVGCLSREILSEQQKNLDLESKCREIQEKLFEEKSQLSSERHAMAAEEAEQVKKEQEIAAATEKLAECQRTILALGKQLKVLASPNQSTQQYLALPMEVKISSERYTPMRCHSAIFGDGNNEVFSDDHEGEDNDEEEEEEEEEEEYGIDMPLTNKKTKGSWDPRDSIASDMLDSELISLSVQGHHNNGRKMYDMFGDKVPAHEDYIEAVAQMPSSPEVEPAFSPKKPASKKMLRRKKHVQRSFPGPDLSKSMSDDASSSSFPYVEKHGSGFARFFSRTKTSN